MFGNKKRALWLDKEMHRDNREQDAFDFHSRANFQLTSASLEIFHVTHKLVYSIQANKQNIFRVSKRGKQKIQKLYALNQKTVAAKF